MNDWGVIDFNKEAIVWKVSEEEARNVFAINVKAQKLVKNIQSSPEQGFYETVDIQFKDWKDLTSEEREKVYLAFCEGESRNESDKVKPKDYDVKNYYEDNAENFMFEPCEHEFVSDGEICLGRLGEIYEKPMKCKLCGLLADEVYVYSCVTRRDTGETISG